MIKTDNHNPSNGYIETIRKGLSGLEATGRGVCRARFFYTQGDSREAIPRCPADGSGVVMNLRASINGYERRCA